MSPRVTACHTDMLSQFLDSIRALWHRGRIYSLSTCTIFVSITHTFLVLLHTWGMYICGTEDHQHYIYNTENRKCYPQKIPSMVLLLHSKVPSIPKLNKDVNDVKHVQYVFRFFRYQHRVYLGNFSPTSRNWLPCHFFLSFLPFNIVNQMKAVISLPNDSLEQSLVEMGTVCSYLVSSIHIYRVRVRVTMIKAFSLIGLGTSAIKND